MIYRFALLLGCFSLSALLMGCSPKGDGVVKGTVTLDGQPLATGKILFASTDNSVQAAEGTITAGAFEVPVPAGEKRVEIRSPKVTGKRKMYNTPTSPEVDVVVELLPEKYNASSELTASITGAGQEVKFDLQSK